MFSERKRWGATRGGTDEEKEGDRIFFVNINASLHARIVRLYR